MSENGVYLLGELFYQVMADMVHQYSWLLACLGIQLVKRREIGKGATEAEDWPFHTQYLIINSPYCLLYNSYDVSSENVVLDQLIILKWYFYLFPSLVCWILYWYSEEKFCLSH